MIDYLHMYLGYLNHTGYHNHNAKEAQETVGRGGAKPHQYSGGNPTSIFWRGVDTPEPKQTATLQGLSHILWIEADKLCNKFSIFLAEFLDT